MKREKTGLTKKINDMEKKRFYTSDEAENILFGEAGTPERDEYDSELKTFLIGEVIKKAREEKNLTQSQLGEMIGVKKGQISKIENGHNITFSTIVRVFKAMGINAKLDLGSLGNVALW